MVRSATGWPGNGLLIKGELQEELPPTQSGHQDMKQLFPRTENIIKTRAFPTERNTTENRQPANKVPLGGDFSFHWGALQEGSPNHSRATVSMCFL